MLSLLLLAACGGTMGGSDEVPVTGDPAPDFTLLDADGVGHSLSDYAGDVILLDLSAFW